MSFTKMMCTPANPIQFFSILNVFESVLITWSVSIINGHTVRLLVPGHFYFYAVSNFLLREKYISILLL